MLRRRAVLPLPAVDDEGDHTGGRRVVLHGGEQSGLRKFGREVDVSRSLIVALDGVDRAAVVVEKVQLAVSVLAERDDANTRPGDLRHLLRAVPLETSGPQAARFPVA